MAEVRKGAVLWKAQPTDVVGPELKQGDMAPCQFSLTADDLSAVPGTALAGRSRIICTVPSLDTPVCDIEMRRFNVEALKLASITLYSVSMDLPFALRRWCAATASDRVRALSDYKDRSFGSAYGVLAPAMGLLVRAVFVVDSDDKIRHVEYVKEVGSEPDYAAALAAARGAA